MPHYQCYPISNPNSVWSYCPSFSAAIAFTVIFSLVTLAHIIQGTIIHKRRYTLVLIMGACWEAAGWGVRIYSVTSQLKSGVYTAQLLLILLAPLWINAFVYMVLGRMVHFYFTPDKLLGLRARRITSLFVWCDVASFIVQATGGSMTSNNNSLQTQQNGIHIYMGGVGLQLLFILIFIVLAITFHRTVLQSTRSQPLLTSTAPTAETTSSTFKSLPQFNSAKDHRTALRLLYTLYLVLTLIVFRNIYRLIEFSIGVNSSITTHEWYTWVFDAIPMLCALLAFNIFHPGKVLRGENSDFGEENRRIREEKKQRKMERKVGREEMKQAKREGRVTEKVDSASSEDAV